MHLSPDKRVVGVLMDNAAQRSLVTKDLVKRLGIKILSKVRVNLLSYGSKVPENDLFGIVSITLGRNTIKPASLQALVVNSINPICMAGASAFP